MEGPIVDSWGPALWSILHSLAERTGFRPTEVKEQEEKRYGGLFSWFYAPPFPVQDVKGTIMST